MSNYKLEIMYDGTRYYGWEHQPDKDTVQGKIEAVLERLAGKPVEVIGAGRTDAGVHAKGMIANVQLDVESDEKGIKNYLNRYLPDDIAVKSVKTASERFHARYNATGKLYTYSCYVGEDKPVFTRKYTYVLEKMPNLEAMQRAAGYLTGTHDYRAFCANPNLKKSTVRTVDMIEIVRKKDMLYFNYHGDGFLQNMVRILTGTLLEVGFGKRRPEDIPEILKAGDRKKAGVTAPAHGLCLMRVDYDGTLGV